MDYIAHIREDGKEQTNREHVEGTAHRAAKSAAAFGAETEGRRLGLAHDLGKYSEAFQRRIRGEERRVDHATAGAKELFRQRDIAGAFAVAGHHGGLPDGGSAADSPDQSTLMGRMQRKTEECGAFHREIRLPEYTEDNRTRRDGYTASCYIRMLYSCLVDADFLDTEQFMSDGTVQRGGHEGLEILWERLKRDHEAREEENRRLPEKKRKLNDRRNAVYDACVRAAESPRGLYTLTVPTGGGKTLSSLAFALRHALCHGLSRIIYVIPYTSIIEQTAQVFREIVGAENVVEHHAQVGSDADGESPEEVRRRLAAENWDAPLIVTTSVQFFESFYSNRPSRCRKLHNLANSVILFDEAQEFSLPYLIPCLKAIEALVRDYRATAVLCTATQPALNSFFPENMRPREICPHTEELYQSLQRTTMRWTGERSPDQLAEEMTALPQVMTIVNTRKEAADLFERLREREPQGCYHLSTLMTPEHRRRVLREVRRRLAEGLPCRLAATSLVEAGVDVDFPRVYREEAGLTSLIQAAGRCNREGRRSAEESLVLIFQGESAPPPLIAQQTVLFHEIRSQMEDWCSPEAVRAYTQALYDFKGEALDRDRIIDAFEKGRGGCSFPFAQVAEEFHLIGTETKAILIPPADDPENIVAQLRAGVRTRSLLRKANPYLVTVYPEHYKELVSCGAVIPLDEDWGLLTEENRYDPQKGLSLERDEGQALFG